VVIIRETRARGLLLVFSAGVFMWFKEKENSEDNFVVWFCYPGFRRFSSARSSMQRLKQGNSV